jgi:hypothetical protein
MRTTARALSLLCVGSALAACLGGGSGTLIGSPGGSAEIDESGIGDGVLFEPYSGRVEVLGSEEEIDWSVVEGAPPRGLLFQADGSVSGSPTWLGAARFTVRAESEDFGALEAELEIDVGPGDLELGLGYTRDQVNNMTDEGGRMWDMWLRIEGSGVGDQSEYRMDPGVYAAGDDGVQEGGVDDDVRVGDVRFADLEVVLGAWQPAFGNELEGDGIAYDGDWGWIAGPDTGELELTLSHPRWGEYETRILAVPPDWCPNGYHPDGGWSDGYCE